MKLAFVNALIAGGIAFFSGSIASGEFGIKEFLISFSAFAIIFLTKMRDYFSKIENKKAMKGGLFEFI